MNATNNTAGMIERSMEFTGRIREDIDDLIAAFENADLIEREPTMDYLVYFTGFSRRHVARLLQRLAG